MNLKNKIVVVTGAASGLGKELAKGLAALKCDLILVDKIAKGSIVRVDLEQPEEIASFSAQVLEQKGYIDILINCAGILIPERLPKSTVEDWHKVINTNLTAPFLLVKYFASAMNEKSEAPLVVNISSKSGEMGSPFCASYVASKHGLNGLTEAINEEYRIHGKLRAVSFCPGSIDTPAQKLLNGYPGIAPKPGIDSILNATTTAQMIIDIIRYSDTIDVSDISFQARKNQIYRKNK